MEAGIAGLRARQLRRYWDYLRAVPGADRSTTENASLTKLEAYDNLEAMLARLMRGEERGSVGEDKWMPNWETNTASLATQLGWVKKWYAKAEAAPEEAQGGDDGGDDGGNDEQAPGNEPSNEGSGGADGSSGGRGTGSSAVERGTSGGAQLGAFGAPRFHWGEAVTQAPQHAQAANEFSGLAAEAVPAGRTAGLAPSLAPHASPVQGSANTGRGADLTGLANTEPPRKRSRASSEAAPARSSRGLQPSALPRDDRSARAGTLLSEFAREDAARQQGQRDEGRAGLPQGFLRYLREQQRRRRREEPAALSRPRGWAQAWVSDEGNVAGTVEEWLE